MKPAFRTVLLIGFLLAATPGASAHGQDVMTPKRAGPIVRYETTLPEMESWFGPPDGKRVVPAGCFRVIKAHWNRGVTVYASRGTPRLVLATFIRTRSLLSDQHGELQIHTERVLRVGDGEGRLRRLYPRARPETHFGHTHYRLKTARDGSYLMAKVIGRRVVQLENWPLEFC